MTPRPGSQAPPPNSRVVAIVPAKNRADTVGATVHALSAIEQVDDIIVVDDGSRDATAEVAEQAGATVVSLETNQGKGAAVAAGVSVSGAAGTYLLIDADTGPSAVLGEQLLEPVLDGRADMTIAVLPSSAKRGGFGLMKRLAAGIISRETGLEMQEPLSGQRAIVGSALRSLDLAPRFGLEVGLTLDVHKLDKQILELPLAFTHRATGRSLTGFVHRGRQGFDLLAAARGRVGSGVIRAALRALVPLRRRKRQ